MKVIIFAGGTGRRLWPLSRKQTPKQFEPIIGSKSTVQLAIERVAEPYGLENVYISTNERYLEIIAAQAAELPPENLIAEPVRRDLGPAVGLALAHLAHGMDAAAMENEPISIQWGDNYMSDVETFREVLAAAETLVRNEQAGIVFMGETPRFANENLGWIELGERQGTVDSRPVFGFKSWYYRPPLEECRRMFASGRYVWNTGYFVTTVGFVQALYREQRPRMAAHLEAIAAAIDTPDYERVLRERYEQMETISFDDAILTHVRPEEAVVLHGEMGWSDPGTLYALKEAIEPDTTKNVSQGLVLAHDSQDCLLYNDEEGKLLAVIGLEGFIVVNTADAILVVHKDDVPQVKAVVDSLEGTELEKYS